MLLKIISLLVSILFWLWIILKNDKFEREPLKSVLFVFILGGLISSTLAGIMNDGFIYIANHYIDRVFVRNPNVENSFLFHGFVGLNEELLKAAVTIVLIRRKKGFNEPADALVYAMSVAFGFAVFETIGYTMKFGLSVFYIRQFNAVPLHIGLAAIWGIGIAKAKFLHQGKYFQTVLHYVIVAALIHSVYNITATRISNPFLMLSILSVFAFFLIRFAIRKMKLYAEDGPFAPRLYCHSCNTVNFPYRKVCKKCGQPFPMEFYTLCPACNSRISKVASSCPKCGTMRETGL